MNRRVALSLPGRSALVPLEISSFDEYLSLQEQFSQYAAVDPYLMQKLTTHFPVFEFFDKEFNCNLQLLPSMATLPSNKLDVRFVPKNSPMKEKFPPPEAPTVPQAQSSPNNLISADEIYIDLLHEQGLLLESENETYRAECANLCMIPSSSSGIQLIEVPQDEQHMVKVGPQKAGSHAAKPKPEIMLKPDDITLPNFSEEVQEAIKSGSFLMNAGSFIRENGNHIVTLKKDPKKEDYETYVSVLLTSMPEIDQVLVGKGISMGENLHLKIKTYVRNKKYRKPVPDHKRKRGGFQNNMDSGYCSSPEQCDSENPVKKKRKVAENSNTVENVADESAPSDPFKAMKKKKYVPKVIIELLPTFKDPRREALTTDKDRFPTIKAIIKEWPPFQNAQVIQAEFLLCASLSEERMKKNFDQMLVSLEILYQENCKSEGDKIKLINRMEKELEINYNAYPMAFSVEELGGTEKPRLPGKIVANAPVCVSFICTDGKISRSYLLAEAKTLCFIDEPTAWDVYKLLVGSYYCYDGKYPLVSKNTLDFLDFTVLETLNTNNSTKLSAFKKRYFK